MALSNLGVFPQGLLAKSAAATAAVSKTTPTAPTNIVVLVAAADNTDGVFITRLTAVPTATSTANVLGIWHKPAGGSVYYHIKEVTAASDTVSTTDPAAQVDFGYTADTPLVLAPGDELHVGILVANPTTTGWHFHAEGRKMA